MNQIPNIEEQPKCTCLHTFELRGERQCKKHPNIEETYNTREVEEIVETIIEKMHDAGIDAFPVSAWQADDGRKIMIDVLHHQLQKAREEERERIEQIFKQYVPPHALVLEDSVWLKRLLNKVFQHD